MVAIAAPAIQRITMSEMMVVVKEVTVVALQRFSSGDNADFSHHIPMSAPLRPTAIMIDAMPDQAPISS
jgi:hypothetical protein